MSGIVGSSSTPSVPSSAASWLRNAARKAVAPATWASVTCRAHAKRSATPGPSGGA
jgi:hypothetical protein